MVIHPHTSDGKARHSSLIKPLGLTLAGFTAAILLAFNPAAAAPSVTDANWAVSGGDPEHQRYSELTQINRDNVNQLEVAWTYRTGHMDSKDMKLNAEPLVFDGVLYGLNAAMELFALDARSVITTSPSPCPRKRPQASNRTGSLRFIGGSRRTTICRPVQ